jgi:hypothetical protein
MANGFIVTKEDWENMTPDQQSWMTFNAVQSMDARLCALEKKRWFNSGCAVLGGAIGGFLFSLMKLFGVK